MTAQCQYQNKCAVTAVLQIKYEAKTVASVKSLYLSFLPSAAGTKELPLRLEFPTNLQIHRTLPLSKPQAVTT